MTKRVGVLTSGGDCAGLNAAIRAIVLRGFGYLGWTIIGIRQGSLGLIRRPLDALVLDDSFASSEMLRRGGTVLGTTNWGDPFALPQPDGSVADRSSEFIDGYRELELDALIGIGGDGSLQILRRLAIQGGLKLVGIPKTIDNDIGTTETSIGFDTAVAVATEALDRLQPTAASHSRVMVVEVMGRDAGHIAVAAGIAGGADVILVPEISYQVEAVARHIERVRKSGRNFALVVVAEAVTTETGERVMLEHLGSAKTYGGIGHYIAERISQATGAITRTTVLGHVQRGGVPTWHDRLIASAFGATAVNLVLEEKFDRMVAWRERRVIDVPLKDAIESYCNAEAVGTMVQTARALGICLGDG